MTWNEERVSILKKMWLKGESAANIAHALGGTTRNAVIGKAHRLKLPKRNTKNKSVDYRKASTGNISKITEQIIIKKSEKLFLGGSQEDQNNKATQIALVTACYYVDLLADIQPLLDVLEDIRKKSPKALNAALSFVTTYAPVSSTKTKKRKLPVHFNKKKKLQLGKMLEHKWFEPHPTKRINSPANSKPLKTEKRRKKHKTETYGQKIIQAIPNADISDIMGIWMNTIRILSDPKTKGQEKDLARKIQLAINNNWVKRYGGKIDENGYFEWPSTLTSESTQKIKSSSFEDWQEEGVLSFYGYHVGNTNGVSSSIRKTILEGVFYAIIPPIFEFSYLYQWGAPETPARLKKMADVLASNARNFKRQQKSAYFDAIAEWEDDLHFLKNKFYIGKFNFDWPNAGI